MAIRGFTSSRQWVALPPGRMPAAVRRRPLAKPTAIEASSQIRHDHAASGWLCAADRDRAARTATARLSRHGCNPAAVG